ncbi:3809_t:CDS:1, partial [Paraglomus brasilianum]
VEELTDLNEFIKLHKIYEIPSNHTCYWIKNNIDLLQIYADLSILLAETKTPPWKAAFGAAVSNLFRSRINKMDYITQATENLNISDGDLDNMTISLQRESFHGVGMVFPVVDRKCYLEIFLIIVNVQKIFFQEVDHIVQTLTDNELT